MSRTHAFAAMVALALLAGGCLGSGGKAAEPTALVIRHTTAAWRPSNRQWREGPRHTDVYVLTCSDADHYPKPIAAVCGQLARHPERYSGRVSVENVATMPSTDFVSVRGVLNGRPVELRYDAGAKPQFPWWSRALAALRKST